MVAGQIREGRKWSKSSNASVISQPQSSQSSTPSMRSKSCLFQSTRKSSRTVELPAKTSLSTTQMPSHSSPMKRGLVINFWKGTTLILSLCSITAKMNFYLLSQSFAAGFSQLAYHKALKQVYLKSIRSLISEISRISSKERTSWRKPNLSTSLRRICSISIAKICGGHPMKKTTMVIWSEISTMPTFCHISC